MGHQPSTNRPTAPWGLFSSENKMMVLVILALTGVMMASFYFMNRHYHETLQSHYRDYGEMLVSVVGTSVTQHVQNQLSPELRIGSLLDTVEMSSPDIMGVSYTAVDGDVVHRSGNTKLTEAYEVPTYPVRDENGSVVGDVKLYLNGHSMDAIASATRPVILIAFLMTLLVSIFAVFFNTYILSKHLRTLVRGVKRLSTGDFGYRIPENDLWGELRILASSFNDMSLRLRAYEDQNLDTITFERNKLQAVLLSIADGVVVCDETGEITIMNDSAAEMLGAKSSSYLVGTALQDYLTEDGEKCFKSVFQELHEHMNEDGTLKTPTTQSGDGQLHFPAGTAFSKQVTMPNITLKVILSPIRDADGDSPGYVMIMHDVTREAEVDKLKTHFISNVSHELRTPVTTIKSYVDTIYHHGTELDEQTYQEFVETIHVETDRLKKLVNDILDFSRLEQGGFQMELDFQDITPIINLTTQSMKVLAQQKNITLTTAIESNLPEVYINSDSIERVIRNLLSNAIKYTEDGGRIRVRAEVAEDSDVLEVSVQDTGIGIPEEHLAQIFDRFYRVENKVHTVKGTGLGLHLVKIAIEKYHHGQVFVKSEVDVGSTFGFRLPLHIPDDLLSDDGHQARQPERRVAAKQTASGAVQEEASYLLDDGDSGLEDDELIGHQTGSSVSGKVVDEDEAAYTDDPSVLVGA